MPTTAISAAGSAAASTATRPEDRIALHCEATSFDAASAQPLRVVALRIRGERILTGQALDLRPGVDGSAAMVGERLRRFVADRPLVGYFLDFSVAMAERLTGTPLPNERVEVSGLYYDRKVRSASKSAVDLRLDSLIRDLGLPVRAEDARGAALAAAMAWLTLTRDER
ncbi:DNA polymerase-3 subunit epsilon [Azospirillum agricola]|uniref:DNA polymerase III n=1 Tax=Azospirillum agricola TaxID=1720247 RepID=UPI001B3B565D|nr:DNA polymerase III [Azospirillum agricola]MBP2232335.1 DNA polymerase-3 subunit epsilon [Azospirillum agricola]